MENYSVERLDHLGVVAGTIKYLGLIKKVAKEEKAIKKHIFHLQAQALTVKKTLLKRVKNRQVNGKPTVLTGMK